MKLDSLVIYGLCKVNVTLVTLVWFGFWDCSSSFFFCLQGHIINPSPHQSELPRREQVLVGVICIIIAR
jgi:hypothetical protein